MSDNIGRPYSPATAAFLKNETLSEAIAPLPPPRTTLTPLREAALAVLEEHYRDNTRRYPQARFAFSMLCTMFPQSHAETLTTAMLRVWVTRMKEKGNAATTINAHLSVVGAMFKHLEIEKPCRIPYVREPRQLKWWLTPEMEVAAVEWAMERGYIDLADYILFVVRTGLRVEEALRLQRMHFGELSTTRPTIHVPGSKTETAQATLPLSKGAADIVLKRMGDRGEADDYLFPLRLTRGAYRPRGGRNIAATPIEQRTYILFSKQWQECRRALNLLDTPTATLKSLRRSYAHILTKRGAPMEVVRMMLRQQDIQTTAAYLRVVGGWDTESLRQWAG